MFDSKQTLTERLSNAVDLAIDFATLGEYGLEPVGSTPRGCGADRRVRGPLSASSTVAAGPRRSDLTELYSLRTPRATTTTYSSSTCGSGRRLARERGVRGASGTFTARGAA